MTEIWEGDIVRAGGREGMVTRVIEKTGHWPILVPAYGGVYTTQSAYLVEFPQGDAWWYTRGDIEPVTAGEYA